MYDKRQDNSIRGSSTLQVNTSIKVKIFKQKDLIYLGNLLKISTSLK